MKVVIMAGGKGTRISSVASDIPKPMIKIEGTPVLEREIECLKEQGFDDILITVSHLGNIIMDYFGDGSGNSPVTGQPFGVHIEYYFEREPLGNAGALFKIKDKLTEDFLLLNADAMFDVDFNRFVEYHKQHDGLVTLFTHPNSHPYDSGLIIADKNGAVEKWLAKEDERPLYYRNRVNRCQEQGRRARVADRQPDGYAVVGLYLQPACEARQDACRPGHGQDERHHGHGRADRYPLWTAYHQCADRLQVHR